MAVMAPAAVNVEPDLAHSFLLAFGGAGEEEVAVGSGGEAEIGRFFLELGVAEEEAGAEERRSSSCLARMRWT